MTGFAIRLAQWAGGVAAVVFLGGSLMYALVLGGHVRPSAMRSCVPAMSRRVPRGCPRRMCRLSVSSGPCPRMCWRWSACGRAVRWSVSMPAKRGAGLRLKDWIASASVLRQFPNRLHIEVVERVPFALWQIKGKFHVIDRDGETLSRFAVSDNMDLPIVVGEGAQKQALRLINDLEAWPDLKSQVRAAALVAERRWTLYLFNGIKVLLPEKRVAGRAARDRSASPRSRSS